MSRKERVALKKDARKVAELDNWAQLIKHYIDLYNKVSQ
jgi:hypothetical protein